MKNLNKDSLFPPSKEKIKVRNQVINESIISFGIKEKENLIHFGCGSRDKSFVKYIQDIKLNLQYTGIDINSQIIKECDINYTEMSFTMSTMQSVIDANSEIDEIYDWTIIDGIIDKNQYDDHQYDFVDTVIRKSIYNTRRGLIIYFDAKKTENDMAYNIDFLSAYISSIYNKYTIMRLNEYQYLICIYKYYI